MDTSTILYITLALFAALGFSFFQYLYNKTHRSSKDYILFSLRALAGFMLLLILINPKITSVDYEIDKTELILLTDNSQSISYLNAEDGIRDISESIAGNDRINRNFEVSRLSFGDRVALNDSLNFSAAQTDIYAALSETEGVFPNSNYIVVLLSDGNQSLGRDFRYFKKKSGTDVFPVIFGDTTRYKDLSVERINANRYAFLNNRFPVEVFLNYSGSEPVEANFNIRSGETIIYKQRLKFSRDSQSAVVRTELPANSLGIKTYAIEIERLSDEKNVVNNEQKFAIEVIDERTSVLILSDIAHPDLGALQKAIGSNQQRSVDIKYLSDKNLKLTDYQLVILYQINRKFKEEIAEILEKDLNYLMITGSKTDWVYLNTLGLGYSKNATSQPQEIFPVYNPVFSSFQFEDIGFPDFPPLVDKFGELQIDQNRFNIMLFQELQGVETGEPLIGVTRDMPKSGFIFGENIWRWRAKSYLDSRSFEEFDNFMGKLVQNLASKRSRQRLTVDADNFYYANQNVIILAQFFDENYHFDPGANLKVTVLNKETKDEFTSDLVLKNNLYQFDGGDLEPGEYTFNIDVNGKSISRSGSFEVIQYNSEQRFVSSNLSGMQSFAINNATTLYYPDTVEDLVNTLLTDDKYKPVQKSRQKTVPLIDWYYLLFVLILILAVEWFYRKYLGLI